MSSMDLDSHQNSFWNNEKLRKKSKILHCILSMHSLSKSKDTVKKTCMYIVYLKKNLLVYVNVMYRYFTGFDYMYMHIHVDTTVYLHILVF